MARIDRGRQLVPSLLDRLSSDRETTKDRYSLKQLKASVQRDLNQLLNTRYRCSAWPPALDELEMSVVNYGIPDFTGNSFSNDIEKNELRSIVEKVLRRFEPRFKEVSVVIIPNKSEADRTIRFRIDAVLWADPAPEPVVFDSVLQPSSNDFLVTGEKG